MPWLLRHGADPHARTYASAKWCPDGHEGEQFTVTDLARHPGSKYFALYVGSLEEFGYDVTESEEDLYWGSEESSVRSVGVDDDTLSLWTEKGDSEVNLSR